MDFRNSNAQEELIYLADESGQEMGFRFLDLILHEEQEYMVLQPAEGPYADEVLILRRERDEKGEESYADVEDPKTLRTVYEIFKEHFRDRFYFTD